MLNIIFTLIYCDLLQKCLDKDPVKRWSCERLLTHSYFDDYVAKLSEIENHSAMNIKTREKLKVYVTDWMHVLKMELISCFCCSRLILHYHCCLVMWNNRKIISRTAFCTRRTICRPFEKLLEMFCVNLICITLCSSFKCD